MSYSLKDHYKKNFHLAYPVMISQLGHTMVGVADSVMVGQLGAVPLAAASLGNVVFFVLMTFGIGVSYAITPLVAAADGEGNRQQIGVLLKHGFLINLVTGLIIFGVVVAGDGILFHLNQPEEVVSLALPYLSVIMLSMVPLMIFQTFRQFAEGLSLTRQAMVIVLMSNLVNILLNYVLIFGKLGFPAMGLLGAGWATLLSRVLMALLMAGYIRYGRRFQQYWEEFGFQKYSRELIRKMLKIGIPSGLQFIFEVGAFGFAAIMMGWLGAKTLAAHQIAINLASVSYMMASGLSAAAAIRVGNQLGRKDIPTLRRAGFTIYAMVLIFMGVCALLFVFGREFLPSLYIQDAEVIAIAAPLIVIAGLFQLSDGAQVVGLGALRGMADVKIPTLLTFIAYWVIGLPSGYVLAFYTPLGSQGIWFGLLIGLTVVAIALFIRFHKLTKRMLQLQAESPAIETS
jgi:multidrug resistance protein, MATE family